MPQGCQQFFFQIYKQKNVHEIGLKFLPVYVNAPKPNNNIVRKTKKTRNFKCNIIAAYVPH